MKIKNLLMAFAFMGLAASCSNDDNIVGKPESTGTFDLKLKVQVAKVGSLTRSIDTSVSNGAVTPINEATLYLFTGNEADPSTKLIDTSTLTLAKEVVLTPDDIIKLKAGTYLIEDIDDSIVAVSLMVNSQNTVGINVSAPFSDVLASNMAVSFEKIQPTNEKKGISNSPMYGYSKNGFVVKNPEAGQDLREASVTVAPEIGRVQVYGEINTTIEGFKLTGIFLDNFITDNGPAKTKFEVGQNDGEALQALLLPYKNIFDFDANGLATFENDDAELYAYHIFPQKDDKLNAIEKDRNVKLILQMNYAVDGPAKTQYATLMLATMNEGSLEGFEMKGGEIYNVDLGQIAWDGKTPGEPFDPEENGDDKPNMGENATVVVDIQPWNTVATIAKP